MQAHHCSSEGAVSSLEEAIGDKEKQISQLREQRDRAEQEKHEERDLHEREIAEYKMKLHTLESEVEKLGVRLDRALAEKDKLEAKLESSQSELGKSKAELDRVQGDAGKSSVEWESAKQRISRYEMENERLKSENERLRHDLDRSTSTFGRSQLNVTQEAERIQEKLDKTQVSSPNNLYFLLLSRIFIWKNLPKQTRPSWGGPWPNCGWTRRNGRGAGRKRSNCRRKWRNRKVKSTASKPNWRTPSRRKRTSR